MANNISQIPSKDTWLLRQEAMWPSKSIDFVKLENDANGIHFGFFNNHQLFAVVSLFIENKEAQFRKLATKPEEQGKGYGTQLLSEIFAYAQSQNVQRIWCNARKDKVYFYERFGMSITNNTFHRDGIDYVIMEKHLQQPA